MTYLQVAFVFLQNPENLKWFYYALGCIAALISIAWKTRKFFLKPKAPQQASVFATHGGQAAQTTGNYSAVTQTNTVHVHK
jgi:bacteriorhodopsin